MKKLFIVANWKSFKTTSEAEQWFNTIAPNRDQLAGEKEIIVCPTFTLLPLLQNLISNHKIAIKIGAQDISPFDKGAYTGEVNAEQIKEFVDYAIIGHSERRKNFSETDEVLFEKAKKALEKNITPIYCVQGSETKVPDGVTLVAYEPVFAIGTGHPDTPENADNVARQIKEKNPVVTNVLYGGSVTPEEVQRFTQKEHIDGVLVGGASLDAEKFLHIITNS